MARPCSGASASATERHKFRVAGNESGLSNVWLHAAKGETGFLLSLIGTKVAHVQRTDGENARPPVDRSVVKNEGGAAGLGEVTSGAGLLLWGEVTNLSKVQTLIW